IRFFFEQLVDDLFHTRGDQWIQLHNRRGIAVQDGVEHCCGGGSGERLFAGGQLVENNAQREKIRARIERLAQCLLGGHVGDGAHGGGRAGGGSNLAGGRAWFL